MLKFKNWFRTKLAKFFFLHDVPMIYTAKGNLPLSELTYHVTWEENEQGLIMHEVYKLNGEIVKKSMHGRLKGLSLFEEQGKL